MVCSEVLQHLRRRPVRGELPRHALELALVAAQVGHADLQELVERQIHRLVEEQLLAVCVRADAVVAARPGQQIVLQELLVGAQGGEDLRVRALELAPGVRVLRLLERRGDVVLEE